MANVIVEQENDEILRSKHGRNSYTVIEEIEDSVLNDCAFEKQRRKHSLCSYENVTDFSLFQVSPIICNFNANPDVIETVYTCGIGNCRRKFQTENCLYQHFKVEHKLFMNREGLTLAARSYNDDLHTNKPEIKKKERKERRYPCGYPGCQWVFTRTNHVARHHERVHPGFRPIKSNSEFVKNGLATSTNAYEYGQMVNSASLLKKHKHLCRSQNMNQKLLMKSNKKSLSFTFSGNSVTLSPENEHNVYVCEETNCNTTFYSKKDYNEHLFQVHSVVEPEICLQVEDKEWIGDEYQKSDENMTKEQNNNILLEENVNLSTLEPIKYLRPPRPYICDIEGCEKTYTKHSHLIRHKVETHKMAKPPPKTPGRAHVNSVPRPEPNISFKDRPFSCEYPGCGWSFKRQYHLNRHLMTHKMDKCNSVVKNNGDLDASLNLNVNGHETSEELSDMNDSLRLRLNLSDTQISNSVVIEEMTEETTSNHPSKSDKPFVCDYPGCGRKFKRKPHLDQHYVVHSGPSLELDNEEVEKNLLDDYGDMIPPLVECVLQEINDKGTESIARFYEDSFKISTMKHSDSNHRKRKQIEKRTFICDIPGCAKKFGRNCELTRHKLNHTDVWPYHCDYAGCGRKFKRKDVFKNHQRTHGKEFQDSKERSLEMARDQEFDIVGEVNVIWRMKYECWVFVARL
ncbi:hypothetical protein B4U79_10776 [Dinothrombium tinctorium]|uniref:C2H2-type domain-containing protein n=1 Tax=Dinothrombium tinctorium TaxID=1965070 RepID=A0A3S3P2S2_9ACAR|nr:hypothetical protein B4U79_10776 [Dinothrombium tinctorium]